eukprot:TRINITY_DN885_c0_g1_i4.p1 TRINITY_DN885_c0_g1~~TRINITY_DN885_c0_g1_i4.p1  ORF type:complete len:228 (+),score=29.83 TRINITY_DN885_c0_g1_i4:45-728(+)
MEISHKFCPWDGHEFLETETACPLCSNLRCATRPQTYVRWRKILYEKQPFEDNYVDKETFLIGLKMNANLRTYDFWTLVQESSSVSQQISIVAIFVLVFFYTWESYIPVELLITLDTLLTAVFGYVIHFFEDEEFGDNIFFSSLKTFALLFGTLLGLSPVLHTLTNSISNDTICALTVILIILHLLFHDYGDSFSSNTFYIIASLLLFFSIDSLFVLGVAGSQHQSH